MKYVMVLCLLLFGVAAFAHDETGESRADYFRSTLETSKAQFESIEKIDKRFSLLYEKLAANLSVKNAHVKQLINQKPLNENALRDTLLDNYLIQIDMRVNNINHHLAIEDLLDSFQRKKFNEQYSP